MKTKPYHRICSYSLAPFVGSSTFNEIDATDSQFEHSLGALYVASMKNPALPALYTARSVGKSVDTVDLAFREQVQGLTELFSNLPNIDPQGSSWASIGFKPLLIDGEEKTVYINVDSKAQTVSYVFTLEYRERILPGACIRDVLEKDVKAFEEREGRLAHKKDIAILKDEILDRMLPKALVRRTEIPVIMGGGFIHVFTSSFKRAEEVTAVLRSLFGTLPVIPALNGNPSNLQAVFRSLVSAYDECSSTLSGSDDTVKFVPGYYAKFKGPEGDTVTVKDSLVSSSEGQNVSSRLHDDGYAITEIDFTHSPSGLEENDDMELAPADGGVGSMNVRISDKGIIKRFEFTGQAVDAFDVNETDTSDIVTKLWILDRAVRDLFRDFETAGMLAPVDAFEPEEPEEDEDDL